MNNARLFLLLIPAVATGCATSLAPSENFNDWTNPAISRHPEPRGAGAATQIAPRETAPKRAAVALTKARTEEIHP